MDDARAVARDVLLAFGEDHDGFIVGDFVSVPDDDAGFDDGSPWRIEGFYWAVGGPAAWGWDRARNQHMGLLNKLRLEEPF
ncbi:MAG TPA: hypothetical protein VMI75_15610 [Polyangiaceae bacterium]|nr:hypothetical protein [Polyangiaceae bacterium]